MEKCFKSFVLLIQALPEDQQGYLQPYTDARGCLRLHFLEGSSVCCNRRGWWLLLSLLLLRRSTSLRALRETCDAVTEGGHTSFFSSLKTTWFWSRRHMCTNRHTCMVFIEVGRSFLISRPSRMPTKMSALVAGRPESAMLLYWMILLAGVVWELSF